MTVELRTDRLELRPFVESDVADYFEIVGDPVSAKAAGFQYAHELADASYLLKQTMKQELIFAIVEKTTHHVIGSIGFYPRVGKDGLTEAHTAELGYVLNRAYWGHGYMPEAGQALLAQFVGSGVFETVWASHLADNDRSKRVLLKLGFAHVDTFVHPATALYQPGETELVYRLDRESEE